MLFSTAFSLLAAAPLTLAGSACAPASKSQLAQAKQKFTASGLVPDFVSKFDPTLLAKISYIQVLGGGTKDVDFGNHFKTIESAIQPSIFLTPEDKQPAGTTYSVFFINFDNPDMLLPPALHLPFLHWQESGLKPCSTAPSSQQTQLFIPSFPQSVNENRYTYLIYREPKGYVPNMLLTADRVILSIDDFAASQNLTLVGGNYFLEGQQDNVPPISK